MFIRFLKDEMGIYDQAMKYAKLKGWIGKPPIYPQNYPGTKERLDSGEAFHLWDHLSSRYDSLEVSQVYQNYVHDLEFGGALLMGLRRVLERQINLLEKEMNHFSLPLPIRPPKSVKTITNSEILEDALMFRQIFTGMQFMLDLHSAALKQTSTNDRLRGIYQQFLWDELDIFNIYIKYGKMKGWRRPAPIYKV